MANSATNAPIIIIKRKKKGHHDGHHGGAWKVAYADFVTAMMAFFLLLWLLNATTEEQRRGISDYFSPASVSRTTSGSGGVLGGMTVVRDGAFRSDGSQLSIPLPATPTDIQESQLREGDEAGDGGDDYAADQQITKQTNELTPEEEKKLLEKYEEERFEKAAEALREAIKSSPELAKLAESLIIDRTPEGLRIQIVDQDKYSMFPLGSAAMYDHTKRLLSEVAKIVIHLPNRIAVTGHTDSTPYSRSSNYTNWELSTDRALASRRALLEAGLPDERIERVMGKADKEHLVPTEPNSPRNRRLSIVLLKESAATAQATQATTQAATRIPSNTP